MAYGLAIWGSDGSQWLGDLDRICRYQGSAQWGGVAGGSSVFLSFPGFTTDGTWFYFATLWGGSGNLYEDITPNSYNVGGEGYLVPTTDGITFYCTMPSTASCANYIVYVWRG